MKKGTPPIILGCVLIALWILSYLGNAKAGNTEIISISFASVPLFLYSLLYTIGRNFVALFGVFAICFGVKENKPKKEKKKDITPGAAVIKTAEQAKAMQNNASKEQIHTAPMYKFCPKCGGLLDQTTKSCLKCGEYSGSDS